MKVVVNAQKNKGGLTAVHGNKVKLDPTIMAIMEKRVADGIAAARAELLAQYGETAGGHGDHGGGMTEQEKAELEALRKRVAGLNANESDLVRALRLGLVVATSRTGSYTTAHMCQSPTRS